MAGTFTQKVMAEGQLPIAKGTLYTVPGATSALIKTIILVNTDASARTINIYVKPGATSRRIFTKDFSLAAGDQTQLDLNIILETGDLLEGDASAATVVDYFVCGVEET
jgi:hypothetical protein